MTLNYSTDRTPGWKVDETIEIPIIGATCPPRLKGVAADDRRRRREDREALVRPELPDHRRGTCKDYPLITPNISYTFRWDGKDAYDRTVQGRVTATIQVIYVYEFNYYGATDEFESSLRPVRLGHAGLRRPLRVRQPLGHDGHALLLRRPDRADDHARDRLVGRAADATGSAAGR